MDLGERLRGGGPRIVREAMWIALAQAVSVVARLAGLRVLTGMLSPGVFGEVALLLGVAALGSGVFLTPIHQAMLRTYPDAAKDGRVNALRSVSARFFKTSVAALSALILLGGVVWKELLGGVTPYLAFVLLVPLLAFDVVKAFETNLLNAARRQLAWAGWNALDACARPFAAVAAVLLVGPNSTSVLLGNAVGCFAVNAVFAKTTVRGADPTPPPVGDPWVAKIPRQYLTYAVPLVPLALLSWIVGLSDRYILASFFGTGAAGLYAAGYGLASSPFIMWGGVGTTALRPVLFEAVARGDGAKERRTILAWLAAAGIPSLVGVVLVTIFSGWIVRIALGEAFWGAAELLPWIAAAYALQAVQALFETMIFAQKRTQRLMLAQGVAAVLAVVFYALLIPRMGAKGAAIATFVSLAGSCAASMVLADAPRRLFGAGRRRS